MYSKRTKIITRRALTNGQFLYVSDQGDITDLDTTVWRGDKTARRWVQVSNRAGSRSKFSLITGADSIRLDKNDVLVTTGTRTDRITGEAFDGPHESMRRPEGQSFTIDGWRAENQAVMKSLAACMSPDRSLPVLRSVYFAPNGSTTVKATSTDRFMAAEAIMQTTSKPVEFSVLVPDTLIREIAVAPAWHLTVWEKHSVVEFCDTGVRIQRLNLEGEYPMVNSLFERPKAENWATLTVEPVAFARTLRGLNASYNFPAGLSTDGYLAADGTGTIRPNGLVEVATGGEPQRWTAFNAGRMAQVIGSASEYDRVTVEWSPEWKAIHYRASDRLRMLLMPVRGGGEEFVASSEIDVS